VLGGYLAEVTGWVRRLSAGMPRRRILDLGAGTGTGTIALAHRFRGAEVIALDVSEQMLARIRARAFDLDLADRVRTLQADLDEAWPAVDPVDLVWASMSLHEMGDPDRLLADVRATIRPGGLVALAEMDGPVGFLPDDLGVGPPGLEERCHAAMAASSRHVAPFGSDWAPRLEAAGFTLLDKRVFDLHAAPPHPATGRYAQLWFARLRTHLGDQLSQDDLDTLDGLLDEDDPQGLLHRPDLVVRGTRTAWVARRP
jgi:SAM-dependent methyltransferase